MSIATNIVIIAGNLTRDVEFRSTTAGHFIASFGIAINEGTKDNQKVTYADITAWDKTAENCHKFLGKGAPVLIEGSLQTESWTDKQTGANRSKLTVVARRVQFLGNKPQDGQGASQPPQNANQGRYSAADRPPARPPRQAQPPVPQMPPMDSYNPDDDIPF